MYWGVLFVLATATGCHLLFPLEGGGAPTDGEPIIDGDGLPAPATEAT